jgi:hypothetical protein
MPDQNQRINNTVMMGTIADTYTEYPTAALRYKNMGASRFPSLVLQQGWAIEKNGYRELIWRDVPTEE